MKIKWSYISILGTFLFFMVLFGGFSSLHGLVLKSPLTKDFSLFFLNAYDIANYHLYNGVTFWNPRPHDISADANFAYANSFLDALHLKFFSLFSRLLANFLWGACEGLVGGIVFLMALKILSFNQNLKSKGELAFCSLLVVLISVTSPTILAEAGTFHSGDIVAVLFFLGWLFFIKGWFKLAFPDQRVAGNSVFVISTNFILFGFLLGVSLGLKLTLYPFIFSLAGCLLLWGFFSKNIFCYVLVCLCGIGVLLGFFLIQGQQMWELYQKFGNPVFPFYNSIFKSPYFLQISPPADDKGTPFVMSAKALLIFPLRIMGLTHWVTIEGSLRDWRWILAFISGVFITIDFLKTPKIRRSFAQKVLFFIFCFCVAGYFIWAKKFGIYRYAFPIQIFSGILIIYACVNFLKNWGFLWRNITLFFITLILIMTTIPSPFWSSMPCVPVKNFPKLPLDSMVILPGNTQSFWALFLPKEVSAINPNFYPFNTIYFSNALNGEVFLSMSKEESKSLSYNLLMAQLETGKPAFLLEDSYSIKRDKLIQPYHSGDIPLKRMKPCYPLEYPFYLNPKRKIQLCQVSFAGQT